MYQLGINRIIIIANIICKLIIYNVEKEEQSVLIPVVVTSKCNLNLTKNGNIQWKQAYQQMDSHYKLPILYVCIV